jgi:pyruvate dehydrogenase E2 component (dihydrolipoamide acetyltransferase)
MELESYKNGKLLYQGAKQGDKIAVNDLLCIIGEEGKVDVNAIVAAAKGGGVVEQKNTEQGTSNAEGDTAQPQTPNAQPQTETWPHQSLAAGKKAGAGQGYRSTAGAGEWR